VASAVVATLVSANWAAPPESSVPAVRKAVPAPEWNTKFDGKEGWVGGDGAYSVVLGPRRVLWLFSDTLIGKVQNGRRTGAVMVNNTVGVQAGHGKHATIRFVAGKTKDGKPAAIFTPADGKGWFWPQGAVRVNDRLFVFLAQVERTKDRGVFAFRHIGQWLAVVANPEDDPSKWRVTQHNVPFAEYGRDQARSWGAAVLAEGEYVYIYGFVERGRGLGRRRLTVARAPARKLAEFESWRFRTTTGWNAKPADATALADGLATEFSVSRLPGSQRYVAVYTENGLGDRIVGRFATAPEGPWSASVLLYRCPEMANDKGVFSYAAKVHPWADGNVLLVSYCVNTWEFARLFRDEAVYRPKFVHVELGQTKQRGPVR
jgi:hypothetical protein